MTRRIAVVAAVIRGPDGRILLAKRPDHVHQGGRWEFPGGKVEPGETEAMALARELHEELGLVPQQSLPLIRICHDYPDKSVELCVHEVTAFTGPVPAEAGQGREGQAIAWFRPEQLLTLAFPAANAAIVSAARLPRGWRITPPDGADDALAAWADAGRQHPGLGWLLRLPDASPTRYLTLAERLLERTREAGIPLLLHGHPARLQALPQAAGIHVPARLSRELAVTTPAWREMLAPHHWLSLSAHDAEELAWAAHCRATCVLLSPLRETASHPGRPGLGEAVWAALARDAQLPVYALGGMSPADHDRVRQLGGQGVAGIRGF